MSAPGPAAESDADAAKQLSCSALEPPINFTTELPACDEALVAGSNYAYQVGLVDDPNGQGAAIAFISVCRAIQGSEPKTYEIQANYDLASLLNDSGICPGNLALLVPAASAE